MKQPKQSEKGFMLLSSFMLITMASIFSLALFFRGHGFFNAAERNQNRVIAFNMAESGVDLAIAELAEDNNYEGTGGYVSMTNESMRGGYSVQVCPPNCDGLEEPENVNVRLISATGFSPSNDADARAYESRSTLAYVQISNSSLFDFAVFADEDMQINGNPDIDSYNSNDGAYDPATANSNGDIATNSTSSSTMDLIGNTTINGDLFVGVEGDPADVADLGPNVTVTGSQSSLDTELEYSVPDVPAGATELGAVRVSGNTTYTLPAGTYYLESLSITGNGMLEASGEVQIYVGGGVSIAGNGVSTSGNAPPNMLIFVTTDDSVSISGNGDLYAGIYAPNSDVSNGGNGEIYGAVVSKTYHQNGDGDVHFDEALNELEGNGGGEISLKAWTENNALMAT